MTGSGRSARLRMTDMMGLTEPGKKAAQTSRRVLAFLTILWLSSAVLWLSLTVVELSRGNLDYLHLALAVIFLVLAIAYFVMWLRSKGAQRGSNRS